MNIKPSIRYGLITLGVLFYLSVLGLPLPSSLGGFGTLTLGFFWVVIALITLIAMRETDQRHLTTTEAVVGGLLISAIAGFGLAFIVGIFARLLADGVQVNSVFAQVLPEWVGTFTGLTKQEVQNGDSVAAALLRFALIMTSAGFLGAILSRGLTRSSRDRWIDWINSPFMYWLVVAMPFVFYVWYFALAQGIMGATNTSISGLVLACLFITAVLVALRRVRDKRRRLVFGITFIVMLILLPQIGDQFQNTVLNKIAIFSVVGIGLNIVLGYAGMLHLGYIAFFAVGAYSYGLLASPDSYLVINFLGGNGINFWQGLLLAVVIGALMGVLFGVPILRTRGDYLAIVTLGFGQITFLLLLNLRDYTGGPGGVLDIPPPTLFGVDLGSAQSILYLAMIMLAVVAFMTLRLNDSRLGRSWRAMKEDEDVASTMGINLSTTKLVAFAIGAAFASAAGVLYATRQVNIFPDNFALKQSIDILSLVIIGGLGSIEGVILGAVAFAGLPEILREAENYRIVAFGALLVAMMILRPQGLLPPLDDDEDIETSDRQQDAWLQIFEAEEANQGSGDPRSLEDSAETSATGTD
jgi:branched-chain amino acid transport system permease protein